MDLTTVFRLIFVVGLATIPVLYWLFVRHGDRNEEGRTERESWSEEHGSNRGEGSTTETPEPS